MRRLLCLLFALPLWACDDAPSSDPLDVAVGSGRDDYTPVTDPATRLRITQGIQGGYHIYGAVRVADMDPQDATVELALWQGDTQVGGVRLLDDFLRGGDGASWIQAGVTVFLFDQFSPEAIEGQPTRMTARVTDGGGRVGRAEMTFTPVCCDFLR
ncbi:MAG: hypothetical protein H6702_24520 [Myxococcales bacterium]|nr:hypothetical protein [Myxococcales bacterium]